MTYPSIEQSEYDSRETFLYLIALPDRTLAYTNAPQTITATIDSVEYDFRHPLGGIWHGSVGSTPDDDGGDGDEGPTESPDAGRTGLDIRVSHLNPIVRAHRSFPPPGNTDVDIYRQNEIDGDPEPVLLGYVVVETPIEDSVGIIRCQHIAEIVSGSEGLSETHGPTCPYMTYSFPCPAVLANHTSTATVTDIDTDSFTVEVDDISQIDGWFTAGVMEAPDGDKRFILDHTGDVLTLQQNFPSTTLKVGDVVNLIDGDDHLYQTCRDKFGDETGQGAAFGGNNLQANKNPHKTGRIQ